MGPLSEEIPVQFGDDGTGPISLVLAGAVVFFVLVIHLNLLKFKDRASVCRERDGKGLPFSREIMGSLRAAGIQHLRLRMAAGSRWMPAVHHY